MSRIITVQDLIDELMMVKDKDSEINVTVDGGNGAIYTPDMFDFYLIDYSDVHPDDGIAEKRVTLDMYR